MAAFIFGFTFLYIYTFALIEGKYSVFLHLQPFRIERYLTLFETILFTIVFSLELFALLLAAAAILWRLYTKFTSGAWRYASWLIPLSVVFAYFMFVTVQFQVLRYFQDGLNMVIVRQLGGGSIWSALHYAASELAQLLPWIIAGFLAMGTLLFLLARFRSTIINSPRFVAWATRWLTSKRLLLLNLSLFVIAFSISLYLPLLSKHLGYSLAHHVYAAPWPFLSDFDLDGYGLVPRPIDHAPLNPRHHPYALEMPANGVDENGVGGDLEESIWPGSQPEWAIAHLSKHNVLLIVLESARADLYHARYNNEWVMPTLRTLPGQELSMIAHTAFTAPAIVSIFNGVHSHLQSGLSLIDRFNSLGYRTGVFSAQNEGFGKQDSATGMRRADTFFDSTSVSADKRMYLSSSSIAAAIPAREVVAQFESWVRTSYAQPFFAYINLQELHFPYSHARISTPLLTDPIPRYAITEKQIDWLRSTYYNAARVIDDSIAYLVNLLKADKQFDNTRILVVGDHGEELFDHGSLGHGTDINFEQNASIAKLINSDWSPDSDIPIGLSEVPALIHNALVTAEHAFIPLKGYVLAFSGLRKPLELGLFTTDGLKKYDFRQDIWLEQPAYGAEQIRSPPYWRLIHLWESLVLSTRESG
jgi:hypothetical protein